MNIRQAKEEIKRTYRAYMQKKEDGSPVIPPEQQRPVLMIGPPGIGKTAIMRQIAEETGCGLLSYTMTHHTRQSAIGLPFISQRVYDGKEYSITEYTMSEIVAAIYDYMEETGKTEGILFLDEVNCVSETLAPVMLQLLQNKTFGNHKLPSGWLIAAAGNPPEYNKSVREMDMVTLDRVRHMEIGADLDIWLDYALERGIHPAVRTYLTTCPDHFYRIDTTDGGQEFVTARGWEDLSVMLTSYEAAGDPVDADFFLEYLQHTEVAHSFAVYYDLFRHFLPRENEDLADSLLADQEKLSALPAAGCLAVSSLLFREIRSGAGRFAVRYRQFRRCKELVSFLSEKTDMRDEEVRADFFETRKKAAALREQHGLLTPGQGLQETQVLYRMEQECADWLKEETTEPFGVYEAAILEKENAEIEKEASRLLSKIDAAYEVLQDCPQGQSSLLYLTSDLGRDPDVKVLLEGRNCPAFEKWAAEVFSEEDA